MKKLLKYLLPSLLVLFLIFSFFVLRFYSVAFDDDEKTISALRFSGLTLLTSPVEFIRMYQSEVLNKGIEPDLDDPTNLFDSEEDLEDLTYRISSPLPDEDFVGDNPVIRGGVFEIDPEINTLGIIVESTKSLLYGESIYAHFNCSSTTVLKSENLEFVKRTQNFFDEVDSGDLVEARCNTSDCSEIFGDCIIVKRSNE